jgi:predicted ATPase/DNA-binding SARP family transcriptional activator/Tfp pilus assembly protein PilF
MTVLRISLLGSFQVSGDHEGELPFTNRKVMGLLAFLALEAGQAHSRETLMGLLWPEMSEADARNNLRVTLARLRKQLEGVTAVSPLTTSRTDVRFQLNDSVTLDAANFQTLLAQTENHTHADRTTCGGCRQRLAAAAALYHGPLLHGLYLDDCPAFDEWLFVQRERFHLQALEVLEELAQGLAADGRFAEAAAHTRRQLELDPLHDSAQRRLLRLLAYQGQTAAALSQFEAIKKTLLAELGIEPDVELLQLAQQIKDGTLPLPDTGAAKVDTSREATAAPRHNLPEILTPFIGRETELAQLAERLAAADYRLITLAGPGGIGKTRLALEAARANLHRFADGAFFVPLDGVAKASEIPAAIAAALNLTFSSEAAPAAELLRILQEKQLLLVVDNLEHIIEEGAPLLLQIVQNAPQVVLLITSRERLNVQAEDLFRLDGLPFPDNADGEAGHYAAVRLFADRAHRLQKTFRLSDETLPHVARICRLVEGLPLGLELAATWVRDFSVTQIADSLAENIDLLATDLRDISPRHRNLAAVFEYSWQLLTTDERAALSQLAVFRGSFTPAAAEQVAHATPLTLTRLRYKSLIRSLGNGRYTMHELLRQLALRKLNESPADAAHCHRRHSHYFLDLLAAQASLLTGVSAAQTGEMLSLEIDNIRQGWRRAVQTADLAQLRQGAEGLAAFFAHMGLALEGAQLLQVAIDSPEMDTTAGAELLPLLLTRQLSLLDVIYTLDETVPLIERVLSLTRHNPALAHLEAEAYLNWSYVALEFGSDLKQARSYLDQAFASAAGLDDPELQGQLYAESGRNYLSDGQFDEAVAAFQQSLALYQSQGNIAGQAAAHHFLAATYAEAYNLGPALTSGLEALRLRSQLNNRGRLGNTHLYLADIYLLLGAYRQAKEHNLISLEITRQMGNKVQEAYVLFRYARVLERFGQTEEAERTYRPAIATLKQLHFTAELKQALLDWGDFLLRTGRLAEAEINFNEALIINRNVDYLRLTTQAKLAQVYLAQGKSAAALALADEVWQAVEPTGGSGLPFPIHTMVECYTVFQACGDGRAGDALHMAAAVMERTAVAIDDPEMRASFLNNVPVNRQLQAAIRHLDGK